MATSPSYTVGDYLAERLAQIGLKHYFSVPGDYNLVLLDKLQANSSLTEVGCANELNCSMAAEGYARACGVSACVVTFSVGAISAFNGTGSAYAENLPLILISGAPNTNDAGQFHLLHHTLATHDYTYQIEMARKITCCAVAVARALDAPRLIDRALRAALLAKKPAYIEIPTNLSSAPCVRPGPVSAVVSPVLSDPDAVGAASRCAAEYLHGKQKPMILVGPKVRPAAARRELVRFAEALGCSVAVQPAAKGMFPEEHPQFVGIFWGQVSTQAADAIVNWADAIICVGTVFNDYSTVGWTAMPTIPLMVAHMDHVTFPGQHFSRVRMSEFLAALAPQVAFNDATMVEYARLRPDPHVVHTAAPGDDLTRKEIQRQLQQVLLGDADTTLVVETGDAWFNGIQLRLPAGAEFEIEMQWGHIGWSVPAAFGYALGKPERKVVILVGDGSFQMTAQEVSQMVRWGLDITILLVNNRGYTIEVEIHDGSYNKIKNWNYALLMQAFNADDGKGLGFQCRTAGDLVDALEKAAAHEAGPTLIECEIHQDDCSKELISWGHYVAAANARPPKHELN